LAAVLFAGLGPCAGAWLSGTTEAEQAEATNFVAQYRAALDSTDTPAADRDRQAWAGFTRTMFAANECLHVD
jgi:hypothetical protein